MISPGAWRRKHAACGRRDRSRASGISAGGAEKPACTSIGVSGVRETHAGHDDGEILAMPRQELSWRSRADHTTHETGTGMNENTAGGTGSWRTMVEADSRQPAPTRAASMRPNGALLHVQDDVLEHHGWRSVHHERPTPRVRAMRTRLSDRVDQAPRTCPRRLPKMDMGARARTRDGWGAPTTAQDEEGRTMTPEGGMAEHPGEMELQTSPTDIAKSHRPV